MRRTINFQSIAWFWDLYHRNLLDLNPSYQRRSVWTAAYKGYFIDTILNGYPAPAIFLYQDISPEGLSHYSVVDGQQRLTTIFGFIEKQIPVPDDATISRLRGKYFIDLEDDVKQDFWQYQFAVEYIPTTEEGIIQNIFDRINRNIAKLTPQELRHARFEGEFITSCEMLSEEMLNMLPSGFPNIAHKSRNQMKDVELTSQLLLLIEEGPKTYSQLALDQAFADRDGEWENKDVVVRIFHATLEYLRQLALENQSAICKTRLRNQADFYSLFGAIVELINEDKLPDLQIGIEYLLKFIDVVDNPEKRNESNTATDYYDAARSAVNDTKPRRDRINIIKSVLNGTY